MLLAYQIIHYIYAIVLVTLILFEHDKCHLCILLLVVSLQTVAIVLFKGCPLTALERKYTQKNHLRALQGLGIGFECDHEYESQIETMIHLWLAIVLKLFVLMLATAHGRIFQSSK